MKTKFIAAAVTAVFLSGSAVLAEPQATKRTTTVKTTKTVRTTSAARYASDVNRLQAILIAMSTRATLSGESWNRSANEAFMLANRINARTRASYSRKGSETRTKAVDAAKELRMHVKMMRDEAKEGDSVEAAKHAAQAVPFAYRLEDWM